MNNYIYINGELIPGDQAQVSYRDRGFMYGDGVFETMRAYNGKVFRLEQHLERLEIGLRTLKFASLPDRDELRGAVDTTIDRNDWSEARVKLTVTRGCSDSPAPTDCSPTVVVSGQPLTNSAPVLPWTAATVDIRRDESSPFSRIKSLNYLPSTVGIIEAREKGVDEGILLNRFGKVVEGTTSNLFLVVSGRLITPSIESGALPGITRGVVIEIAREGGIALEERTVERDELEAAEEVFATNSIIEIRPVTSVNYRTVGTGGPGPVTQEIARKYRELVEKETS